MMCSQPPRDRVLGLPADARDGVAQHVGIIPTGRKGAVDDHGALAEMAPHGGETGIVENR